jgi:hypothetical protein
LEKGASRKSLPTKLYRSFMQFFANIVNSLKRFIQNIKRSVSRDMTEIKVMKHFADMEKEIRGYIKDGYENCMMTDYKKLTLIYAKYYTTSMLAISRILKNNYKSPMDIEKDFNAVKDNYDDMMREAKEISENKIEVTCKDALAFVVKELSGNGLFISTLLKAEDSMKKAQDEASIMLKSYETFGGITAPERMNIIERIVSWFIKSITNAFTKFIIMVCVANPF